MMGCPVFSPLMKGRPKLHAISSNAVVVIAAIVFSLLFILISVRVKNCCGQRYENFEHNTKENTFFHFYLYFILSSPCYACIIRRHLKKPMMAMMT